MLKNSMVVKRSKHYNYGTCKKTQYIYTNNVSFVDNGECPCGCCHDSWRGHGV